MRKSPPRRESAAAAVTSFMFEAGFSATSVLCAKIAAPVVASSTVTLAVSPKPASATSPARRSANADGNGEEGAS